MYDLKEHEDWLVCTACGTQFPTSDRFESGYLARYVTIQDSNTPPAGQSGIRMNFHPYPGDDRFVSVVTVPKGGDWAKGDNTRKNERRGMYCGICLTYIDDDTVKMVKEQLGGLQAIAFDCPVYLVAPDRKWVTMEDDRYQKWVEATEARIKVVMLGGHFPGSLVLLYDKRLLIADTLMTTPAGMGNWKVNALGEARQRPAGMNTFSFMWSIPNMIPLSPPEIYRMWDILKAYEFTSTHGAFLGQDIEDDNIKERVRESAEIQIRAMGSALYVPN
ncbi:hypothetical protein QBC46DRAFT_458534 [Diplogelasinospora grovesii]|uniref:Uncharacterized protein n=1 Tax=Diplogelasinospora grovesii TaxID=303347 RepID=A0AAN6S5D3_9PEZI|nr:hypothetical protein QBC46DRAFT_458534 [Diplogelasinospora grovesii]